MEIAMLIFLATSTSLQDFATISSQFSGSSNSSSNWFLNFFSINLASSVLSFFLSLRNICRCTRIKPRRWLIHGIRFPIVAFL